MELIELHRLIIEGEFLPRGSDIADRFSLVMGMAAGTILRVEASLPSPRAPADNAPDNEADNGPTTPPR